MGYREKRWENRHVYASSLPRVPELAFKVNISANIGGELAEALVERDKIFLADHQGIYALSREDGSLVWVSRFTPIALKVEPYPILNQCLNGKP